MPPHFRADEVIGLAGSCVALLKCSVTASSKCSLVKKRTTMLSPIIMRIPWLCLNYILFSHVVFANNRYKSRPDLSPPRLNITLSPNRGLERGYIFIAPFNAVSEAAHRAPQQPGAYIFSDDGELVWSGYTYFSTWTGNFQAARLEWPGCSSCIRRCAQWTLRLWSWSPCAPQSTV